jgi:hypothetical protein
MSIRTKDDARSKGKTKEDAFKLFPPKFTVAADKQHHQQDGDCKPSPVQPYLGGAQNRSATNDPKIINAKHSSMPTIRKPDVILARNKPSLHHKMGAT